MSHGPRQAFGGLFRCVALVLAALSVAVPAAQGQTLSVVQQFRRLIDFDTLYQPPANGEKVRFFRGAAGAPCAETENGWCVRLRVDGPGLLTRFWTRDAAGQVRIEVDGQPVLEASLAALFEGQRPPFVTPLSYRLPGGAGVSYVPIGFQQRLRVLTRDAPGEWEAQVTVFDRAAQIAPFSSALDADAAAALEEVRTALTDGLSDAQVDGPGRIVPIAIADSLAPGQMLTELDDKPGVIRAIYLAQTQRADPADRYALHRCVLRIYFDGAKTPAIEAPVAAFFANGFVRSRVNTLPAGANRVVDVPLPDRRRGSDDYLYFLLPMPYQKSFRLELLNAGTETVDLLLYLRVSRQAAPAGAWQLNAGFHRISEVAVGRIDWHRAGACRWVGSGLLLDSPAAGGWAGLSPQVSMERAARGPQYAADTVWGWLAGDGTGSSFAGPLQVLPPAGGYGKSLAIRWMIVDAVLADGLSAGLRVAPPAAGAYVGAMNWWYAPPGEPADRRRLQSADLGVFGLRIPHSIEIEGRVRGGAGVLVKQKNAPGVEYSGEAAVTFDTGRTYEVEIPTLTAGTVDLQVRVHPRRKFGTVTIEGPAGVTRTIEYAPGAGDVYSFGTWALEAGANPVKLTCSEPVTLDCWIARPEPAGSGHDAGGGS